MNRKQAIAVLEAVQRVHVGAFEQRPAERGAAVIDREAGWQDETQPSVGPEQRQGAFDEQLIQVDVAVALQPGRSGWIRLAGAVLVAASANVWNGLDVRPGRAIKFGLVAFLGLVGVDLALLPTLPGVVVQSRQDTRWRALVDLQRMPLADLAARGFTIAAETPVTLEDIFIALVKGREGQR